MNLTSLLLPNFTVWSVVGALLIFVAIWLYIQSIKMSLVNPNNGLKSKALILALSGLVLLVGFSFVQDLWSFKEGKIILGGIVFLAITYVYLFRGKKK